LPFRSKDNSLVYRFDPWVLSSGLHGILIIAVIIVFLSSHHRVSREVDIQIIEKPRVVESPVRLTEPRVRPVIPARRDVPLEIPKAQPERAPVHEVFGLSPKAITSDEGVSVKTGNTVAKAPDQEVLKTGDPELLPVPAEEYLVTNMPELKSEVRIPYPSECKRKGIQGAVVMDLLIDTNGKVRDTTLVEGPDAELNNAALSAAKRFLFIPALIKNQPVAMRIRYTYRFVLER
jgi:TonB family protein